MSETFNFAAFYDWVVADNPNFIRHVEVGVYKGDSIVHLARKLIDSKRYFQLYAVDLWERVNEETTYERKIGSEIREAFLNNMRQHDVQDRIDVVQGDSVKAATIFRDYSLDFVFIDANHTYDHVISDIRAWLPKIRHGGIIAGHDYGEPGGVKQAVDEMFFNDMKVMGTCWYYRCA